MRRKIAIVLAIASITTLLFTGCKQRMDENEANIVSGLDDINQIFHVNETEATLQTVYQDAYCYENGIRKPVLATSGDGSIVQDAFYLVTVGETESNPRYQALFRCDWASLYYVWQSEQNIIMTEEQTQKANALYTAEKTWGDKHDAAFAELKDACILWLEENLMEDDPVLLAAEDTSYDKGPITTRLKNRYYVVMLDGTIYQIEMQWPAMQVLSLTVINGW